MSFSESSYSKKLVELENTQQSIQTLSMWMIHHRKNASKVVGIWCQHLKREREPRKLLNLLYLCNDVVQNSRKKGDEYVKAFTGAMEKSLAHMCHHADEKAVRGMKRIVDIWKERLVFSNALLDRFGTAITSNLSRSQCAAYYGNSVPKVTTPAARPKPTPVSQIPATKRERSSSSNQSLAARVASMSHVPSPETPQFEQSGSKSPKDAMIDIYDGINLEVQPDVTPPTTEQLLKMIHDLDGAASADKDIRERISKFPGWVADLNMLDLVNTKVIADQKGAVVDAAHQTLSQYNEKLSQELAERKTMLDSLGAYRAYQKQQLEQDQQLLAHWQSKLAKLGEQEKDLIKHVDSLADIAKLNDKHLMPLPESMDLFTK